uniref:Uncharacterized protein n=1 Tax=Arion vulgaris TaxID=1028688 RepID=A0A0B7BG61_9EUPU
MNSDNKHERRIHEFGNAYDPRIRDAPNARQGTEVYVIAVLKIVTLSNNLIETWDNLRYRSWSV